MCKLNYYRDETVYGIPNLTLRKRSIFYRLFKPNQADYHIQYDDNRKVNHHQNTYDPIRGGFPSVKEMHEHHW